MKTSDDDVIFPENKNILHIVMVVTFDYTVKIIRQGEKILLKDSILLNEDNVKISKKLNIYQYSNYLNRQS